ATRGGYTGYHADDHQGRDQRRADIDSHFASGHGVDGAFETRCNRANRTGDGAVPRSGILTMSVAASHISSKPLSAP
ncbi:hypothetical protein KZY98_15205, partial [Croceibacter atlanticus]|nr:hypothetical protein [Croceibacter atlanticus]